MKAVYLAVNIEPDYEFDAIAFETREEMYEFCREYEVYQPFETGQYTVKDALDIFGVEYNG